ncbi:MAG: 23S rRNA (guanosine(2251)-2'-O)-methyltransferase RlmB [Pseudomonadota bacterium]
MKREKAGGINAIQAMLEQHPERLIQLWTQPGNARVAALAEQAKTAGIPVQSAKADSLSRLVHGDHHQGIVAEFQPVENPSEADLDAIIEGAGLSALLLVLDQVQDPHNLGACLRSAAAAGAQAVIVPRDRSAGLTPAARRAAAGAAESLPLVEVANLARTLQHIAQLGVWLIGLAGEAETALHQIDLKGPVALVMGGEENGLRRLTRERCDVLAKIPMPGAMESLNVSVATGIALFEALRQRSTT